MNSFHELKMQNENHSIKMRVRVRDRKRSPYVVRKTFERSIVVQLLVDSTCAIVLPHNTRDLRFAVPA